MKIQINSRGSSPSPFPQMLFNPTPSRERADLSHCNLPWSQPHTYTSIYIHVTSCPLHETNNDINDTETRCVERGARRDYVLYTYSTRVQHVCVTHGTGVRRFRIPAAPC